MQVFISWSGERSKKVADALRAWLPRVIQGLKPWMSDSDIKAGSRWLAEVSGVLDATSVGIICVTPENLTSPWLNFEAGALSKALDESRVCPIGLGMTPGQISGPLSQFQAVTADKPGILRVLAALNGRRGEAALAETELLEIFDVWWPHLEQKLGAIEPPSVAPTRSTDDQLEELLQISREQLRRENLRLESSQQKEKKLDRWVEMMEKMTATLGPLRNTALNMQRTLTSSVENSNNGMQAAVNASPDEVRALMSMLGPLMGATPSASSLELPDVSDLQSMVADMKAVQAADKARLIEMLSPPQQSNEASAVKNPPISGA